MAKLDPTLLTFDELLRYADRTNPWIDELIKGFEDELVEWELREQQHERELDAADEAYRELQRDYEREIY